MRSFAHAFVCGGWRTHKARKDAQRCHLESDDIDGVLVGADGVHAGTRLEVPHFDCVVHAARCDKVPCVVKVAAPHAVRVLQKRRR